VALHRGAAAATLAVPLRGTWMEGCKLGANELGGGHATQAGDDLQLSLGGNHVLLATCL
jgi:hypothetical protein